MKSGKRRTISGCGVLLVILAGCTDDPLASIGGLGQSCYPNNTCDSGLVCQAGQCVAAAGDDGGVSHPDVDDPACEPGVDSDDDTIDDLAEGCVQSRDSDGDEIPDYLDVDSDNDGLADGAEDRNGDGRLGCCRQSCGEPIDGCPALSAAQCAPGQVCRDGSCSPATAFECSDGESDPTAEDTFGLGSDALVGNTICTDDAITVSTVSDAAGDWTLALPAQVSVSKIGITGAGAMEAASALDHEMWEGEAEVAGFVVSRAAGGKDIAAEVGAVRLALLDLGSIVFDGAEIERTTHDGHDTVIGISGEVKLPNKADVRQLRNDVIRVLLGRPFSELTDLPPSQGMKHLVHRIRLSAVLRADGRLLLIGSVIGTSIDLDPYKPSREIAEDLGDGSALAGAGASMARQCDAMVFDKRPMADVIWVVDESSSMDEKRAAIAQDAKALFAAAQETGLDIRMAVTSMVDPDGEYGALVGKFCSRISEDATHDGGTDRFLFPDEAAVFASCINNPPGVEKAKEHGLLNAREAIEHHLPRAAAAPHKIRTQAQLWVFIVTDEVCNSAYDILHLSEYPQCTMAPAKQAAVDETIEPYKHYFRGITNPERSARVHLIAGVCGNECGAHVAHGYKEVSEHTGGETLDICQQSFTAAVGQLLETIDEDGAQRLVLDGEPIPGSLRVTVDGQPVERARSQEVRFRFIRRQNAIVLLGVPAGNASKVIVSYSSWQ